MTSSEDTDREYKKTLDDKKKSISKLETKTQKVKLLDKHLLLKCRYKPKEFKRYGFRVGGLLFPPSDSEPVADDGLNHKGVLEVANAVAPLRVAPLNTCKKEEGRKKGDALRKALKQ